MSSMRNAAPRRPHRERSQPQARQKWGLLEKHKDYSLRAADYNNKQKKLKILSQKVKDRHPDEFAFGMIKTQQGKLGRADQEKNRLSHDAVRLLKEQDSGYLRVAAGRNRKELEKVKEEIGLEKAMKAGRVGNQGEGKVMFDEDGRPLKRRRMTEDTDSDAMSEDDGVEDDSDTEKQPMAAPELQDTDSEDEHGHTALHKPTSKKQQQKRIDHLAQLKANRRRRKRLQEARAVKLDILRKRQKEILAAADALDLQRAKIAKVVGGTNKNGVKFKVRERKR